MLLESNAINIGKIELWGKRGKVDRSDVLFSFRYLKKYYYKYYSCDINLCYLTLTVTFLSFSDPSVRTTPFLCICEYRTFCNADMSHLSTYSTFEWRKYRIITVIKPEQLSYRQFFINGNAKAPIP